MKSTVKMPKVADSVDVVTVIDWQCSAGGQIAAGDVLMHVETDKAIVEVPCPIGGRILDLLVQVEDDVRTGTPIVVVETD